ncbi:Transcription factor [Niveomyces insectorum RCEF 264]|uniref:Transcription factor n=1 Tax=Niveomyces insectorum RCEF 264 TaxID=1081102 RepID=A0A167XXN2_9HYPO|nr:Transcription factor [Niveomyces insectorum RCEF 264]
MEQQASNKLIEPNNTTLPGNRTTIPQLNCELCRERKVKCDKLEPCTTCMSAGVACVPVHRLRRPRGRHVRRSVAVDEDVKRRIRRLEALIDHAGPAASRSDETVVVPLRSSQSSDRGACASPSAIKACRPGSADEGEPEKGAPLVQCPDDFWADLAEEIHGLRDVIESGQDEAEDGTAETPDAEHAGSLHRGISVLGLSGSSTNELFPLDGMDCSQASVTHNRDLARRLCQVYLDQVDPITKILHRPSIAKLMLRGDDYLNYPDGHVSVEALRAAVMYAAACSMTDRQCGSLLSADKPRLVAGCRRACEGALERADLLTTRDITALQAFVLYLVGRRTEECSRAVWTLLAVAVRVAKAQSLHVDTPTPSHCSRDRRGRRHETFFAQQMRRRLWLTICLLDVQAAFGMTSQPLVGVDEAVASFQLPAHINDADFGPDTRNPVADREGLTDTTYSTIKYKLQHFGRLTHFAPPQPQRGPVEGAHRDTANDGAALDRRTAHEALADQFQHDILRLRVAPGSRPPPARVRGDTALLRASATVLEQAMLMHTDPRGEGFRWAITVPWHALAIAVAECYLCTDADLLRTVWPVLEASYRHYEAAIARVQGGALRGPLRKLMACTRQKVGPVVGGPIVGPIVQGRGCVISNQDDDDDDNDDSANRSSKAVAPCLVLDSHVDTVARRPAAKPSADISSKSADTVADAPGSSLRPRTASLPGVHK